MTPTGNPSADRRAWPVALAGILALAVAMGIGRFAFTPLLPLMMRDGLLDAAAGAELAAANYIGYLLGALSAPALGARPLRLLRLALAGVVLLTLAMPLLPGQAWGWALRAAAGACSAWVLVGISSWGLRELVRRAAGHRGALVYAGVGLGIAAAGGLVWLLGHLPSASLWTGLGLLAALGTAVVLLLLRQSSDDPPAGAASPQTTGPARSETALVICYGSFGFGYIVPATFLPALARQQIDDPRVFGLAWPLFGLAAALSVAVAARWLSGWPRRRVWALAQSIMALGTLLPLLDQRPAALALSAVFVGGTFMVATMAGLQLARERAPQAPTALLARMTSAFAAGQIAGPLLVRALAGHTPWGLDPLGAASLLATAVLVLTAAWLWRDSAAAAPA